MKIKALLILLLAATSFGQNTPNLYIRHTSIANTFCMGFETIPNYKYTVFVSRDNLHWGVLTNFTASNYVFSMTRYMDEGPKIQLFKVTYVPALTNGQ